MWMILIILVIMILSSISAFYELKSKRSKLLKNFLILNSLLTIILTVVNNILYFFILFEVAILPIFLIIIGWGYQPEKIEASIIIFFYTLVGSFPLRLFILYQFSQSINVDLMQGSLIKSSEDFYSIRISLAVILRFLVKFPLFSLHLWLPLAHVEAPVYGSIILAGILLKLGGMGIIRFIIFTSSDKVITLICLIGLVRVSLIGITCLQTTDIKKIIAFSSVAHIRFRIVLLCLSLERTAITSFIIMIVHAFRSSGMFLLIYIFYTCSNSRNLILNRGLLTKIPLFRFLWLMILISRLGGPPAINLITEILCFIATFNFFSQLFIVIFLGFLLTRAFHLILYRSLCQGKASWENLSHNISSNRRYYYIIRATHVFYTVFIYLLVINFFN